MRDNNRAMVDSPSLSPRDLAILGAIAFVTVCYGFLSFVYLMNDDGESILSGLLRTAMTSLGITFFLALGTIQLKVRQDRAILNFFDRQEDRARQNRARQNFLDRQEDWFRQYNARQDFLEQERARQYALRDENEAVIRFLNTVLSQNNMSLPKGKNAKKLDELAPKGFDLTTVPERLCCPISTVIMDDPVIDPTTLNKQCSNINEVPRVDRAWLQHSIFTCRGVSPLTRQVVSSPLIPDDQRKAEVDSFMQLQEETYSSVTSQTHVMK